jgi:hypothetical protein
MDTSLPTKQHQTTPRNLKIVDLLEKELAFMQASGASADAARLERQEKQFEEYLVFRDGLLTHRRERRLRYQAIRSKVQAWSPPDELRPIKECALRQIEEGLEHDCRTSYETEEPIRKPPEVWRAQEIDYLTRRIASEKEAMVARSSRIAQENSFRVLLREEVTRLRRTAR